MRRASARALAVILGALATAAAASEGGENVAPVTIGTGGITGLYHTAGEAICRVVNLGRGVRAAPRCRARARGGSLRNIAGVHAGELDFAIVQSRWQYRAWSGGSRFFSGDRVEELRAVFALQPEPLSVLVRRGSGFEDLATLAGRRVHLVQPGAELHEILDDALGERNLAPSTLDKVGLEGGDPARALCDGIVDALLYAAAHPVAGIAEASNGCDVSLLDVGASEALLAEKPFYRLAKLPGGTYRGIEESSIGFGVGATLITSAAVADATVYELVRAVFENLEDFTRLHPAFESLSEEEMISDGLSAPLHDGALRYYRERGWL